MSLTLAEFHSNIREAIGRGDVLDAVITARTRQAARWFERNASYQYMEKFTQLQLNSNALFPHILDLPNTRIKHFKMFRILSDADLNGNVTYKYLKKIDPKDESGLTTDIPSGYWLANNSKIRLDNKPDMDYNCELIYVEYSAWPTASDGTHWILDNGEDFLFNQTMLSMAPWVRDPRMVATYKELRDEALVTLEGARIDLEDEGTAPEMVFS